MKNVVTVLASAMVLLSGSAFGQTKNGSDMTAEIQSFCNQYDDTWNNKGPGVVADTLLAKNIIFLPSTGAVVIGSANVHKIWGDTYHEPTTHKCIVQGASAEGDGAWAYGEVTITGNPAGHVRWSGFSAKQNGQWKVQLLHVTPIKDKE